MSRLVTALPDRQLWRRWACVYSAAMKTETGNLRLPQFRATRGPMTGNSANGSFTASHLFFEKRLRDQGPQYENQLESVDDFDI